MHKAEQPEAAEAAEVPVPIADLLSGEILIVEQPAEPVAAEEAAVMPAHPSEQEEPEGPEAAAEPVPVITGPDISAAAEEAAAEPVAMVVPAAPEVAVPRWDPWEPVIEKLLWTGLPQVVDQVVLRPVVPAVAVPKCI